MSIMEVVKKVNKKYYLFIIYLNFSFIMLSTRMDNHRQNIRKEFPVKEYQIIRNPDDFFSDLDKVYKYYDGGRYYNDYYYILKNRNFEKEKIIIYFKFDKFSDKYRQKECLKIKEYDDENKVLKFFELSNIEKYYSNKLCSRDVENLRRLKNDKRFLFGKYTIEDNSVKLELYSINDEEKIIKKKFVKKNSIKLEKLIKEIDNEQEQKGFYRVPIYFEVYTIYTPNKIIHEDLIFTSENRKELVSNLKKLFKIEFYKYFSL